MLNEIVTIAVAAGRVSIFATTNSKQCPGASASANLPRGGAGATKNKPDYDKNQTNANKTQKNSINFSSGKAGW